VYVRKPLLGSPNLILVDFKIWLVRRLVARPGWEIDEYQVGVQTKE
jgi:hypothetical protein